VAQSEEAMGIDELQHRHLLALDGGDRAGRRMDRCRRALISEPRESLADRLVRDIALRPAAESDRTSGAIAAPPLPDPRDTSRRTPR
jgi:hypothetical protein